MIAVLAVAAGAFIGSPLRFLLDRWLTGKFSNASRTFPVGLFAVNIIGSAAAGIVIATTTGTVRIFLLVGVCGAFTTFSGFGWQALQQWRSARAAYFVTVIAMTTLCMAAFWLSYTLLDGG